MLRSSQLEGKRRGRHTWWMLVAGEGPGEDVRRAPQLAQSPPPGKEGQDGGSRERERERERGAGRGEREKEIDEGCTSRCSRQQRRLDWQRIA